MDELTRQVALHQAGVATPLAASPRSPRAPTTQHPSTPAQSAEGTATQPSMGTWEFDHQRRIRLELALLGRSQPVAGASRQGLCEGREVEVQRKRAAPHRSTARGRSGPCADATVACVDGSAADMPPVPQPGARKWDRVRGRRPPSNHPRRQLHQGSQQSPWPPAVQKTHSTHMGAVRTSTRIVKGMAKTASQAAGPLHVKGSGRVTMARQPAPSSAATQAPA